jgi:mannose-6-phosphate isomerase-like protein (cupin superfamily)
VTSERYIEGTLNILDRETEMKAAKRWGSTEVLIDTPFCEVHRIQVRPQEACSRHKHEFKNNAFYVEKGELIVWMEDGDKWAKTHMQAGDIVNVPPGIEHQFETWDVPCVAFEVYFPDGCKPDIVRRPE